MRLVLEQADLLQIIGKHLNIKVDPEKFKVRTENGLEVEITSIPMSEQMLEGDVPPPSNVSPLRPISAQRARLTTDINDLADGQLPGHTPIERNDPNAFTEPPPEGTDGVEIAGKGHSSPAAIIAASRALEEQLNRENPNLAKPRRGGGGSTGSLIVPPYGTDKERS